jgi:hypothetical protein
MGLPEGVALPLIINEVHAHTTTHEKHERINRNIFFILICILPPEFSKGYHLAQRL